MATPTKRSFRLLGADGRPLHGDLRSGGGVRPAVVLCHGSSGSRDWGFLPDLADRLARAGFAVVSFAFADTRVESQLHELGVVLEALRRGTVGVAAEAYGLIGHDTGGAIALLRSAADERVRALVTWAPTAPLGRDDTAIDLLSAARAVRVPLLELPGSNPTLEQSVRASIDWMARHLP